MSAVAENGGKSSVLEILTSVLLLVSLLDDKRHTTVFCRVHVLLAALLALLNGYGQQVIWYFQTES